MSAKNTDSQILIRNLPVTIVVGLTGVGKTTSIVNLQERIPDLLILPNRRELTDQIIIPTAQTEDGEKLQVVNDRLRRFHYTSRYRETYPGGMAFALSTYRMGGELEKKQLLFDGLRGLEEVKFAVKYFEKARFLVLHAPDMERLRRILKRNDEFDTTSVKDEKENVDLLNELNKIEHIEAVFSQKQIKKICSFAQSQNVETNEVLKKAKIIVSERSYYDPESSLAYLKTKLSDCRLILLDTAENNPQAVVKKLLKWF